MICLSRAELLEVSGFRRKTRISKWLRQNGFVFVVAADGWPRVDGQHYHARMGTVTSKSLTKSEPNLSGLMEQQRNGKKKTITTRSA
jgi:hypothetical protein